MTLKTSKSAFDDVRKDDAIEHCPVVMVGGERIDLASLSSSKGRISSDVVYPTYDDDIPLGCC